MLAVGAGIVVASVALLKTGPSPTVPAMGRHVSGLEASRGPSWDTAVGADFVTRGQDVMAQGPDLSGKLPLAQLELAPNVVGGETAGFAIRTMAETGPLAEAGLRNGDVLMTIDGLLLDADRARRLADEFGGLDDVEVTYQRGGELRETLIVFRPR